jgi:TonB family protein
MRFVFLIALLLGSTLRANGQIPQRNTIKPPVLKNRAEIVAERKRLANRLLERGDSLLIRVYVYVDENGVTRYPEIKTPSGNAKADSAAMVLVRKMAWHPAQNTKRGVMLTIPVVFVRK